MPRRYQTGAGPPTPLSGGTKPPRAPLPPGCIQVDTLNFSKEVQKSTIPVMLYFHVESHEEVRAYTKDLLKQVGVLNSDPAAPGVKVKLALVNCEREPQLAQAFRIQPDSFPLIMFLIDGKVVDKMVGIVSEPHIQTIIQNLLQFVAQDATKAAAASSPASPGGGATASNSAGGTVGTVPRMDLDDENVMTLVQTGMRRLQERDHAKAETLFKKAIAIAEPKVADLRTSLGLHTKKMTPEAAEKLKKDPHYLALPQAFTGLALLQLATNDIKKAAEMSKSVRDDYPWAARDQRLVADALARIDMLVISGYNPDTDSYVNLCKRDEFINEPVKFYNNNLKLAMSHYLERNHEAALEELLRLIRAEPKLLPELRRAGICDSLSTTQSSPARKMLFLMFEGIGNDNAAVVAARKRLAAFINC